MSAAPEPTRHDWTRAEVQALFDLPLSDLILRAQAALRAHHDPAHVQRSRLLNIKTGGCAENCGYCSQSAHFPTGVKASRLMDCADVAAAAARAKAEGAERFCMGAAWRELKDRDLPAIVEMIKGVKALGLETCMTLGMLSEAQAEALGEAGLDFYNHNLDTGPEYYPTVVSTRTYQDRLDTLEHVRRAGVKVCCGGILGMGERQEDRADLIVELAKLKPHPESIPINQLVPIPGTPFADATPIDGLDFVRWIAVARIVFPASYVRLAAGRDQMSQELQAMCLLAGANSIFVGDKLLTTPLPGEAHDRVLLDQVERT
ncbi:MAG: biotin synthase BioB [Caulobacteraceae bacterium]